MTAEVTSVKLGARKADLQHLAEMYKRSVHSLLLEAVDEYLTRSKQRIAYEQDAIQAYEHFQETGLHVGLDELKVWQEQLANGKIIDFPQCHKSF
ncbi:MAG: hypothetical protein Q4D05_03910 [Acinetobacter sp.]|nr:hypothetical protein [Acinetobacter sp.]